MNKGTIDLRAICKYGENCYQKNPLHHKRFKHPPHKVEQEEEEKDEVLPPPSKKPKPNEEDDKSASPNQADDNSVSPNQDESPEGAENEKDMSDEEAGFDEDNILITDSPMTKEESIRQKFLIDMPQDFYDFWDFCKSLNNEHPEDALSDVGLKLVGPFDVLSGTLKAEARLFQYLCHWRFYFDPPEFQTVIVGATDEFHIGYFRDDPSESPAFLASMSSLKPGIINTMKEDLFSTVFSYINSVTCKASEAKKNPVLNKIKSFSKEKSFDLNDTPSARLKERKKKVVSKTFHGAGIVVPFDKVRDVGYREIPETTASLKRILKAIDEAPTKAKKDQNMEALDELLTNVQFANDEGDFGMGVELGLDLFTYGSKDFHSSIHHLLTVGYDLLNRKPFAKIIKAHLGNRKKGSNLNAFQTKTNMFRIFNFM